MGCPKENVVGGVIILAFVASVFVYVVIAAKYNVTCRDLGTCDNNKTTPIPSNCSAVPLNTVPLNTSCINCIKASFDIPPGTLAKTTGSPMLAQTARTTTLSMTKETLKFAKATALLETTTTPTFAETRRTSNTVGLSFSTDRSIEQTTNKQSKRTNKPTNNINKLINGTNKSAIRTDTPTNRTNKPTNGTNKPTNRINKLTNGTNKQTNGTNKQTIRTDNPTNRTNKPTNGTNKPTNRTDKPTNMTDTPTNRTDKPINITDTPTNRTDKPTNTTNKPTNETNKPTNTTNKATNETNKPTNTTYKPTNETNKPTNTTNIPTNETNKTPVTPTVLPSINGTTTTPRNKKVRTGTFKPAMIKSFNNKTHYYGDDSQDWKNKTKDMRQTTATVTPTVLRRINDITMKPRNKNGQTGKFKPAMIRIYNNKTHYYGDDFQDWKNKTKDIKQTTTTVLPRINDITTTPRSKNERTGTFRAPIIRSYNNKTHYYGDHSQDWKNKTKDIRQTTTTVTPTVLPRINDITTTPMNKKDRTGTFKPAIIRSYNNKTHYYGDDSQHWRNKTKDIRQTTTTLIPTVLPRIDAITTIPGNKKGQTGTFKPALNSRYNNKTHYYRDDSQDWKNKTKDMRQNVGNIRFRGNVHSTTDKSIEQSTNKPTSRTNKRTNRTDEPTNRIDKPTSRTDKPTNRTDKPTNRTDKATSRINKPKNSKPAIRTNKRASKTNIPTNKTNKPTNKTNKPTNETSKPTNRTNKPTNRTNKPAKETNIPTNETSKPTNRTNKPTNRTNKPPNRQRKN